MQIEWEEDKGGGSHWDQNIPVIPGLLPELPLSTLALCASLPATSVRLLLNPT